MFLYLLIKPQIYVLKIKRIMGNTCKSMADSCQCMTKTTTIL